ncbi:hypothetical protein ACPPVS_17225 [Cellulomonas sp. McL0617]|uniref:hypothetical protein n=1 Tax=Cellulomonas sp. McL0617 TaxID=3415675 RepID=UPI003CF204BF
MLAVISVLWVLVAGAVLLLSGTAGQTWGWLWCVLAFAPLIVLAWAILRPARRRAALTAGFAVVIVLIGLGVAQLAQPSIERVNEVSANLPVPSDAHLMSVDSYPNDWCTQGCSYVERLYSVPDGAASVATFEASLQEDGWHHVQARWCRGDYGVVATAVPRDSDRFASQAPPPDGLEALLVTTSAQC